MNFNDLYKKIVSLNTPINERRDESEWNELDRDDKFDRDDEFDEPEYDDDFDVGSEEDDEEIPFDECGMNPMMQGTSKQSDNISMNVNMTGAGPGGIRDLLDVLKNIDQMDEPTKGTKLFGVDDEEEMIDEKQGRVYPIDSVLRTGNDLHGKGGPEPRRAAGGGNPYRQYDESLINRLSNLYTEIKSR